MTSYDARTKAGSYRPDQPFGGQNMRITLRHERGVTPAAYLKVPFRFQAPPLDRFGRTWEHNVDTFTTIGQGERPRDAGNMLKRPSFQTMLLDEQHAWMVWGGSFDVQRMVSELAAIAEKGAIFRLTVGQPALWGPRPLLNMLAAFTSLEAEARSGEVGTEYANVEFIEWPHTVLDQAKRRPSESDKERRVTVKAGDTLYKLAKRMYKRSSAWHSIAAANGIEHVSPDSAAELAKWMKAHHRTTLKVPPLTGKAKHDPKRPNVATGTGIA